MRKFKIDQLSVLELKPFSVEIEAGETVCLTGPSGSGKSMLMRAMADLIPHQGELYIDDTACSNMRPSEWRKRIAFSSAESAWWRDSVDEHFIKQPDTSLLAEVGFEQDVLNWSVSRLSSGEKQRLALIRILANNPEVLLLDEPTASLDVINIERVETLMKHWQQQHRTAIIWVSHHQDQIQRMAHRVLELNAQNVSERPL